MKISRDSLQSYFDTPLPTVAAIADAFTFHCFEIDAIEGDVLDVKVLPNRAADCKDENGIARELGAILDLPLKAPVAPDFSNALSITTTLARINGTLGATFSQAQVEDVCRRLGFKCEVQDDTLSITPPADRVDIIIPEDIAEEVGRILGYDNIVATQLPSLPGTPDQARYHGIERMKDQLIEQGFIEVSTQSFAITGDIYLANPLDSSRPALRTTLENNLKDALVRANQYAAVVLGPNEEPRLFEVGTVFPKEGEFMELRMTERVEAWGDAAGTFDNLSVAKLEDYGREYKPKQYSLGPYQPFSVYPFIVRDIALWAPVGTESPSIEKILHAEAGPLLVRVNQFDTFEKDGRISYGFRLVFQAMERTLTDSEVGTLMEKVSAAVRAAGYEPR